MNNQRIAIIVLAAIGMGGTFLPWAAVTGGGEMEGTNYSGWITFFLFLIPAAVAFVGNRRRLLNGVFLYIANIAALVAAAVGLWEVFELRSERAAAEYGLYLVMLCGVMIPLAAFLIGEKAGDSRGSDSQNSGPYSQKAEVGKKAAPD